MKRNEMKVGETYAVLAPSQKVSGSRYGFPSKARKVIVVDTEPVWYSSSYHGWNSKDKPATVIIDGTTYEAQDDETIRASDYRDADAKRSVKVLEVEEEGTTWRSREGRYLTLTTVPLSQVRMTWAEYEVEAAAETERGRRERAARDAAYRRKEAAQKAAAENAAALNRVLEGTDVKARILDGEVVLAGPLEVLRAIIETANDQSFTAKKEAGVR